MNIISMSRFGKIIAGLFLIGATIFGVMTIFAYFPNKMPALVKEMMHGTLTNGIK